MASALSICLREEILKGGRFVAGRVGAPTSDRKCRYKSLITRLGVGQGGGPG